MTDVIMRAAQPLKGRWGTEDKEEAPSEQWRGAGRADFGGAERDVLVADDHLQLLPPAAVRLRPAGVVLLHDLRAAEQRASFSASGRSFAS